MSIRKGTGSIKRGNASNYTFKQADARMQEAISTYQNKGKAALNVDSFEVKLYHACSSTQMCTCQQTEVIPEYGTVERTRQLMQTPVGVSDKEITIDYSKPLFGSVGESLYAENTSEDDLEIIETNADEQGKTVVNNLFSSSSDCALCYRKGTVPGFELFGYHRVVLTTYDIVDTDGYHLNITTVPHCLNRLASIGGYVEFLLEVPKYFTGAGFSIRNNKNILVDDFISTKNGPLTLDILKQSAGKELRVRCESAEFTHVVFEFDLGTDKVRANLSQASRSTDWTLFDTLSSVQVVLPATIQDISTGDVLHVPTRNTTFVVTDEQYLRVATGQNLDWQVTVRVVQPVESLRTISKVTKL